MKELEFYKKANRCIEFLSIISIFIAVLMTILGISYPVVSELIFNEEVEFDCAIEYMGVIAVLFVFFVNVIKK